MHQSPSIKPSIAFFDTTPEDEGYFKRIFSEVELSFCGELNRINARKAARANILSCFALATTRLDAQILDELPALKLIATRSTGYDHIDIAECRKRLIQVTNVPSYGENTVAEHTFALILAISRKIIQAHEIVRGGNFGVDGLTGFDLKGKTIGIIGTGKIGAHVARIANGFQMKILAFDTRKNPEVETEYKGEYRPLLTVLENSDIITLHVPLVKETTHLINSENIQKVKKGAILINTARGAVVESKALLEGLNSGILAGAGLDVLEEEGSLRDEDEVLKAVRGSEQKTLKTILENHILLRTKNVLITPHNAFNSYEALQRIRQTTTENIRAFLSGSPENMVR